MMLQIQPPSQTTVQAWLQFVGPLMTAVLTWITLHKLNLAQVTADKTHALVNSQMGQVLLVNAFTTRTLANLTNLPNDILLADKAEKDLKDHNTKQIVADKV